MNSIYAMSADEAADEQIRLQTLADLHRSRRPPPESFSPEDEAIDAGAPSTGAAQVIVAVSNLYGITELDAAYLLLSLDFAPEWKRLSA